MKSIKQLLADVDEKIKDKRYTEKQRWFFTEQKQGILDATASFRAMLDDKIKDCEVNMYATDIDKLNLLHKLEAQLPEVKT